MPPHFRAYSSEYTPHTLLEGSFGSFSMRGGLQVRNVRDLDVQDVLIIFSVYHYIVIWDGSTLPLFLLPGQSPILLTHGD